MDAQTQFDYLINKKKKQDMRPCYAAAMNDGYMIWRKKKKCPPIAQHIAGVTNLRGTDKADRRERTE